MNPKQRQVDPKENERVGFLVITRRQNEGIMLGEDLHVIVTKIGGGQVRLAVYAPRSVKISKSEVPGRGDSDG